jgi:hypothetical protein
MWYKFSSIVATVILAVLIDLAELAPSYVDNELNAGAVQQQDMVAILFQIGLLMNVVQKVLAVMFMMIVLVVIVVMSSM